MELTPFVSLQVQPTILPISVETPHQSCGVHPGIPVYTSPVMLPQQEQNEKELAETERIASPPSHSLPLRDPPSEAPSSPRNKRKRKAPYDAPSEAGSKEQRGCKKQR